MKRIAAAITKRGRSSSICEDTQENLITVSNLHSDLGTGITPRGLSTSFSQETEYMSRTSGVTIQHGVDVDDVQSSSENAKTPLLQLAQEISMGKSDTKVAVQSDESPIVVSSDSEDNASKKKKEDQTRKVAGDMKQSEKPRFCMIKGNWIQRKLDSVDHMQALYSLGANFILGIELLGYPTVNIDARDENIAKGV